MKNSVKALPHAGGSIKMEGAISLLLKPQYWGGQLCSSISEGSLAAQEQCRGLDTVGWNILTLHLFIYKYANEDGCLELLYKYRLKY